MKAAYRWQNGGFCRGALSWHVLGKPILQMATHTSWAGPTPPQLQEMPMVSIRLLIARLIFIGVLVSASAVVLAVILMLRFPPILIAVCLACLLFH